VVNVLVTASVLALLKVREVGWVAWIG